MIGQSSNPKEKFGKLYREIAATIDAASSDLSGLSIHHEEGRQKQKDLLKELQAVRSRFREELGLLEEHAEWEKLTVAFFGETNAGKSTIIESLRILLNEEGRQTELASAGRNLEAYEQRLQAQASRLSLAVEAVEQEQIKAQERFREAQNEQQQAFKDKLLSVLSNFESKQHGQVLELASQIRKVSDIAEEESSARTKRRVQIACGIGLAIGILGGSLATFLMRF